MRVISGRLKGKKLKTMRGAITRPTADRVKEALFNILAEKTADAVVLDLYAGTGALGIETLSRGARLAVLIENAKAALSIINDNLRSCALAGQAHVIGWDILKNLRCLKRYPGAFTMAFMDPPYNRGMVDRTLQHLLDCAALSHDATVIVEHDPKELITINDNRLILQDIRRYGQTSLSFFIYHSGKDCINSDYMLE